MKVYLVAKRVDHYVNKFIPELVYGLKNAGNEVDVGLDILWTEKVFQYDIIYFQWPEFLFNKASNEDCINLKKKIDELKLAGKTVVAHCHNLKPHDPSKIIETELYKIIYGNCDVMIHMGEFSLKKMQKEYPNADHFLVPHHIYSHFYSFGFDKLLCRKELGLPENKTIILSFGVFRNDRERSLFLNLRKKLDSSKYEMVAPSFFRGKLLQKNIFSGLKNLFKYIKYKLCGIEFSTKFIDDDDMEKYFCAADIILIQRPDILNSGNLPMGFAAGKIVVGPNVGNVSDILCSTNNPVFKLDDKNSLINAIEKAKILVANNYGLFNKKFAETYWTPERIGQSLTTIFQKVNE